jgi:hypothetical protein
MDFVKIIIWILVVICVLVLAMFVAAAYLKMHGEKLGSGEKIGGAAMLEQIKTLADYQKYVNKNPPALKIGQVVFNINNEMWISGINYFQKNLSKVSQNYIRTGGAMPAQKVDTIQIAGYTIINPHVMIKGKYVPVSALRLENMADIHDVIDNTSPIFGTRFKDDYTIYIKYKTPLSLDGFYYIFSSADEQELLDDLGVPRPPIASQLAVAAQPGFIPVPPPLPPVVVPLSNHRRRPKRTYVKKINIAVELGKGDEIIGVMQTNYAKLGYDMSMEDFVYGEMEKNDIVKEETFLKTYVKYILKAKTLIVQLISSDEIDYVILPNK